jgi:hypothetical protein
METSYGPVEIKVWLLNEKHAPVGLDISTIGVLMGKPSVCEVNPAKPAYAVLRYSAPSVMETTLNEDVTWIRGILNKRQEAIERGY